MKERRRISKPIRETVNSIYPKDDAEINSEYYGDDRNISTQIVTNYMV